MKRGWGHVWTGLALGALVGVSGTAACVHDDSTIFVSNVLAPQFVTPGMECTFTADPTQPVLLGAGMLDAALKAEYGAVYLVGNQIVPRGDPNQPHTETSYVNIQGAVVRIVDSSGNQLNTFTFPAAATIPPSSGTSPGYATVAVTILDQATVTSLTVPSGGATIRVVSYVKFFGSTLGGESVESNEFGFPIEICQGCLVSFPAATQSPNLPIPNCANAGASTTVTSVPCSPGQDLPIDCAACQGISVCDVNESASGIVDAGAGG